MRLLRCHIENFGVLSGFDYEFPEGLAVICRENGFGKSTLAAFLKAMFYGLPRTGARNVTENERRRSTRKKSRKQPMRRRQPKKRTRRPHQRIPAGTPPVFPATGGRTQPV